MRYGNTLSSYTTKMLKKIKMRMKAPFFGPDYPVLVFSFLAIFKLAYDTIRIQDEVAMQIPPFR